MEAEMEIKNRIDDLKWRALSPYERALIKRKEINRQKFGMKRRFKELKWTIQSMNVLTVILLLITLSLLLVEGVSTELIWFLVLVEVVFLLVNVESSHRLSYLKEVKFLKQILKNSRLS